MIEGFFTTLVVVGALSLLALWGAWGARYGAVRGTLAFLCRAGWVVPLVAAFYPKTTSERQPRSVSYETIHVLLDDSRSMKRAAPGAGTAPSDRVDAVMETLRSACERHGCLPKVTRLSEKSERVAAGYTPLAEVFESFYFRVGEEPWLLVSDGGDSRPGRSWTSLPKRSGEAVKQRSMIVGFEPTDPRNVGLEKDRVPPFAFENQPFAAELTLHRAQASDDRERVQIQVLAEGKSLTSLNAVFEPGEKEAPVTVTVPPLSRGQHLLTIKALPTGEETTLWDNTLHAHVEVMPNTVGVLHLLGSPSWDGRFLRRYLKAEPKYDLISFFILRDPWDRQDVSERELSLIPFPVERLFNEELQNFRVVIIQNFTLRQFLKADYQRNLVEFVKNGGGLLFMGGPRGLQPSDIRSSPLRDILPFETSDLAPAASMSGTGVDPWGQPGKDWDGPAYDPELSFDVEMARPPAHKRALANVYDDWEPLADSLTAWDSAQGLHRTDRVKFKDDVTTQLLTAKTEAEKKMPLAVASYPGEGRAIWLFSDSFWRLAMETGEKASRSTYNRFFQSAMTWLTRQELRKPLVAKHFEIGRRSGSTNRWRVMLRGPAARYFEPAGDWTVKVCGAQIAGEHISMSEGGTDERTLSGPVPAALEPGDRCRLTIEGKHEAFGRVEASTATIFPRLYKDREIGAAPQVLRALAGRTGARLALPPENPRDAVREWVGQLTGAEGVALPERYKSVRNFYWVLDQWWFWVLMALMPLEVLVRRWEALFRGAGE